jgi:hypothetical protein
VGGSYAVYKAAMADPWKRWWVTWPLAQQVRIGDVFTTSGGTQRTAGNLAGRGIKGLGVQHGAPPADFTYDSGGSVSFRLKSAGHAPAGFSALVKADAGALVEFGRRASALVIYAGLSQQGLSDSRSVAAILTQLYWDGLWDEDLVVVSDVISARAGTVLVATQGGASAELRVATSAQVGPATLVDLAGDVSFARLTHVGLKWSGHKITPFYHVIRLRKSWARKITSDYGPPQPGAGAAPVPVPPLVIDEASDDPDRVIEDVADNEQPDPDTSPDSGAGPESLQ